MAFPEVHTVAVIGSVARALWKEVPRFSDFRREGIEVWHECRDLDLALWIESQQRLREIHRAANRALSKAFTSGAGTSVVPHQLDIFMFNPTNDAYLGRLCSFNQCPKGKRDCLVPGCGAIAFNKAIDGFVPRADLLAPAQHATLYRRGAGRLRSALDLPGVGPCLEIAAAYFPVFISFSQGAACLKSSTISGTGRAGRERTSTKALKPVGVIRIKVVSITSSAAHTSSPRRNPCANGLVKEMSS